MPRAVAAPKGDGLKFGRASDRCGMRGDVRQDAHRPVALHDGEDVNGGHGEGTGSGEEPETAARCAETVHAPQLQVAGGAAA